MSWQGIAAFSRNYPPLNIPLNLNGIGVMVFLILSKVTLYLGDIMFKKTETSLLLTGGGVFFFMPIKTATYLPGAK
jgi:hypothetical protein